MHPPSGPTVYVPELASTQEALKASDAGIVWTDNQTAGRGRLDRSWFCEPGNALAISFRFDEFKDHPTPYLVGMGLAVLVAKEFDLRLQWPNDIVWDGKKVGGILTEVHQGVPIVGLGLNLTTTHFPKEISHRATSLLLAKGHEVSPKQALERIMQAFKGCTLCLDNWKTLGDQWAEFDSTRGKTYSLPGGNLVVAQHVTQEGHLFWMGGAESGISTLAEAYYEPDK